MHSNTINRKTYITFNRTIYLMRKLFITYCLFITGIIGIHNVGISKPHVLNVTDSNTDSEVVEPFDVYPNPATDYVFVKFDEHIANDASIEVRSFIGNKMTVESELQSTDLIKLNIADIPAGHYYIVITIDGASSLKKFVKHK